MATTPKRVFVWDLDDTLMWTSWAYSKAFMKFCDYLLELSDFRLLEFRTIATESERIDKKLIKTIDPNTGEPYGFTMHRFPESLVRTYQWLCENDPVMGYQELVARRVRMIGYEAFDPLNYKRQGLVRGGVETLEFIGQAGDMNILVTKGDQLVQDTKVVALDLDRWFGEEIYVVDDKDAETFNEQQNRFPRSRLYSVGNSYKSDIAPALEADVGTIYIPYYTWLGEKAETEVDTEQVLEIKQIDKLVDLHKGGLLD